MWSRAVRRLSPRNGPGQLGFVAPRQPCACGMSVPNLPSAVDSQRGIEEIRCRSWGLFSRRRAFSTAIPRGGGQDVYQDYVDLHEQLEQLGAERERRKSEEMYQAWQRTEEDGSLSSNKSQGVAVVKTLVKQTRKDLKQSQEEEKSLRARRQEKLQAAALDHNHPDALVQLGNQALRKAGSEKLLEGARQTIDQCLDLYQRAGAHGSKEGWFNHGHLLWTGYPDQTEASSYDTTTTNDVVLTPSQTLAMESFDQAIRLGDSDSMYFVGVQLLSMVESDEELPEDDGRFYDMSKGFQLIQQAVALQHAGALYYEALLYLNGHVGLGLAPCPPTDFQIKLNTAIEAGSDDALFLRGHSLYHGDNGYPRDFSGALSDFLRAADSGHADAAVSAGAMLHAGRDGVPHDRKQAFELYQHAGELGSLEGWRNVAACYATGEGVAQSSAMAKYIVKTMKLTKEG
jgi:TPR repeat protein